VFTLYTSELRSAVNMTTTLRMSAKLDRTDTGTPWGFRMTGGKDFGAPLIVQRVSHGGVFTNRMPSFSTCY